MQVIECGWQGKDEVRPRDGILRVTAGHRISGVRRSIAEQFTGFWFGLGHFGDSKWMLVDALRCTENRGFHVNLRKKTEVIIVQVLYAHVVFSPRALLVRAYN